MNEPLIDVTGHRQRRRREIRRRRLRRVGVVAGILAVVAGVAWLVWWSPFLAVQEVRVEGNQIVTAEAVVSAAAVPENRPLARIDTTGTAARVGVLPPVARADVERTWPNTITIKITERTVRLAVPNGPAFDWVDAAGVVFNTTPTRPDGVMLGEGANNDPKILAGVVKVVNALPPKLAEQARRISASSVDSITVHLADGSRVVWGSAEDSDLKAQVISVLIDTKATVYDVSSPTHPTTRQ